MAPPVVIAGAGLHGAALAYYLTLRGVKPLLIDQHSVAAAASAPLNAATAAAQRRNGSGAERTAERTADEYAAAGAPATQAGARP